MFLGVDDRVWLSLLSAAFGALFALAVQAVNRRVSRRDAIIALRRTYAEELLLHLRQVVVADVMRDKVEMQRLVSGGPPQPAWELQIQDPEAARLGVWASKRCLMCGLAWLTAEDTVIEGESQRPELQMLASAETGFMIATVQRWAAGRRPRIGRRWSERESLRSQMMQVTDAALWPTSRALDRWQRQSLRAIRRAEARVIQAAASKDRRF